MSELQVKTAESRFSVLDVALTGVFTALVFVMTMFVQVQIIPAQGGLVHLGNVPLFFAAAFFGKKVGALCGGLGMALSDLVTPWQIYAPISLIVVGLMGLVFGMIVNKKLPSRNCCWQRQQHWLSNWPVITSVKSLLPAVFWYHSSLFRGM